jgi:hypothetical protein
LKKVRQTIPTGKLALTFIHHTMYVVHEVGQYDTIQEAQEAARIGKGLIAWRELTPNHWDGWGITDLGFHYTISPGNQVVYRTQQQIEEEKRRQATLYWRRQMEAK